MNANMTLLTAAKLFRDAGAVKRYHVKRVLRTQTVAEHTFGVLMLVKQVMPAMLNAHMVTAILHHDLPELITGDIPAPIKRAHPELGPLLDSIEAGMAPLYDQADARLTAEQHALLKWADRMELVQWCLEEWRMGNTYVKDTIRRGMGWIQAARIPSANAVTLTNEVLKEMESLGLAPATGAELEMKT